MGSGKRRRISGSFRLNCGYPSYSQFRYQFMYDAFCKSVSFSRQRGLKGMSVQMSAFKYSRVSVKMIMSKKVPDVEIFIQMD